MITKYKRYYVIHHGVVLEVTSNLEEAFELAREVSARHNWAFPTIIKGVY